MSLGWGRGGFAAGRFRGFVLGFRDIQTGEYYAHSIVIGVVVDWEDGVGFFSLDKR